LAGKVVIDMNNGPVPPDLAFAPVVRSFAERLSEAAPHAKIVKAFNTIAQETFEHTPDTLRANHVATFLASDHPEAKTLVADLAQGLGFTAVDAGPLVRARMLESMADLVRAIMIGGAGPYANYGFVVLPAAEAKTLGGRLPTSLG
jgi:8-hydroxy-5-deazaflavin:NADPH oxidoreductase